MRTNHVVMVRPHKFEFNPITAKDNVYQNDIEGVNVKKSALVEFDRVVEKLKNLGVKVSIIEDNREPSTPDSIFPNNWFTVEKDRVTIYPMYAKNRELEKDKFLKDLMAIAGSRQLLDISTISSGILEGTGSVVFDHYNKKAYCALSNRSNEDIFNKMCEIRGYKPISFVATDDGKPIYHTNVLMSISEHFAIVCLESIEEKYRNIVISELKDSGKEIVEISYEQLKNFAGNSIELEGDRSFFVMSKSGYESLRDDQIEIIQKYLPIETFDVSTIEKVGGGSIRCMIAEFFK